MPALTLGPLLRHVDSTSATIWVETDAPATVTVAGTDTPTFTVAGHHYALVVLTGLAPGTSTPYEVALDGEVVWPPPEFPPSRIRTFPEGGDPRFSMLFGTCRMPDTADPAEQRRFGIDALAAYAHRMRTEPDHTWPDALLLAGDQIYADETTTATRAWLATRRDVTRPPGHEVANFEEYTHLYHESWSTPDVRWLLSTVPTSMLLDDHDVRDDWNTSQAWRGQMAGKPWWPERELAALMSYWVYQHLGNLSPTELAQDPVHREVRTGDVTAALRDLAERAVREVNGHKEVRWSYCRDFGTVRLLAIDTRAGRTFTPRAMLSDAEFTWLEQHADGDHDHLLIGTSLPWLMPHAISDLQSVNEVACRRPGWRGALAERVRQAGDLEHWPSFRDSADRLTRLILGAAKGNAATVTVLSGDVHHVYAARARFPEPVGASVHQLVCSPLHNQVPWTLRPPLRAGWWRPVAAIARWWARVAGVAPLPVTWTRTTGPHFGNAIAVLHVEGRRAKVVVERATGTPDAPALEPLTTVGLTD
ncbi:phosphodiesterase [Actinophytocola xinjiangensis]|uniref:Phosphodiesterase n=1 Tax=Actinophytocola xinjiangensis TaxID=485602 RepID=A0A7Z0WH77_9PSEU|nr:alkaline phosphatase D family protein [Actinophytocola xinjiangensis]OLF07197.1 phosphodiesterase [Actinophytocola xinjiangensis]